MLFNSLSFLVFFVIVLGLHHVVKSWDGRKNLLLVASYLFYSAWNPPYVLILAASTCLDWKLAQLIAGTSSAAKRKVWLVVSLVANLGALATFKYADFLLANFQHIAGFVGLAYSPPHLGIVLPVGISFYTFASLSYTIDVYRREIDGKVGLRDYALFVSFFPHLVAGPIVRASYLLPQIAEPRRVSKAALSWGLVLMVVGLFCKAVLADSALAPVVDRVYEKPEHFAALDVWVAVVAFSGQIYFDFAGYSLCAVGIALCFGFAFPDNFRFPYAAFGFSDFWRRWHISLSTWLRDYLYVPMGGNRRGVFRTYLNLILTMLIGGLWHGASWMFVIWGALHGGYLVVERGVRRLWRGRAVALPLELSVIGLTFLAVTLAWIPFRATSMEALYHVVTGLWREDGGSALSTADRMMALGVMTGTLLWHFRLRERTFEQEFSQWGSVVQGLVIFGALLGLFAYSGGDERAFIYFQF